MVEAPRIRILYDNLKFIKNKIIINASGASYKRLMINLQGYLIKKWWFAGKYIYVNLIDDEKQYVIRTHLMMYGKIIINNSESFPKLTPFLILILDDNTTLTWYLSQIKILDPNCDTDSIKSNYTICSSKKSITDSYNMMHYDISNKLYNYHAHMKHLLNGIDTYRDDIFVDFLLDQTYFPGVGNILQQEALYRCQILPTKEISKFGTKRELKKIVMCLVDGLKIVVNLLYQSYLDKLSNNVHKPIFKIYHKSYCPLNHKTITKYLGFRERRTTWCPICQV